MEKSCFHFTLATAEIALMGLRLLTVHAATLTFPCMSNLMVKVTLSPPSTRLESIAAAESTLTLNWPTKWIFGHWLNVCNKSGKCDHQGQM